MKKGEKKEVILDNCILQRFERIPETLNVCSVSNQRNIESWEFTSVPCPIHQTLDLLNVVLDTFLHFVISLKDVKPKWTQHTVMGSPETFSRNHTASCLLRLHSAQQCFETSSAFPQMHEFVVLRAFGSSFVSSLTNQNLLLLNLRPRGDHVCMKC